MSNRTYFLGCPTPDGFETYFKDEIRSDKMFTYIIKGGPGTGKSTLMKRLAQRLSEVDEAELYYCSSDPDSLDAVVFRRLGIIFVDGTAPHVFEPSCPGVREKILDLGQFWNSEKLREHGPEILRLSEENAACHARAKRYLGAACGLNSDTAAMGSAALLEDKLKGYASRLSARLMSKGGSEEGKISIRQITSVTPKGVMTQRAAFEGCEVYSVDDDCFAVTDRLLKLLASHAAEAGYNAVASKNVFLPGCAYEQVVIPGLNLAFVSGATAGEAMSAKVNALRFYDRALLRERKHRMAFNNAAVHELTAAAVEALADAKSIHDELESNYIEAMDFGAVARLTDELAERFLKSAK